MCRTSRPPSHKSCLCGFWLLLLDVGISLLFNAQKMSFLCKEMFYCESIFSHFILSKRHLSKNSTKTNTGDGEESELEKLYFPSKATRIPSRFWVENRALSEIKSYFFVWSLFKTRSFCAPFLWVYLSKEKYFSLLSCCVNFFTIFSVEHQRGEKQSVSLLTPILFCVYSCVFKGPSIH